MLVARLALCDLDDGAESVMVAGRGLATDDFRADFGDDDARGEGLPWLVTRMVVRLSSLLPRREEG